MFMRCRWQEAEREVIRTKHQHNAQWELKEMRLIKKTLSTLQAENHIWWNVWQFARFFSEERRQQQRVRGIMKLGSFAFCGCAKRISLVADPIHCYTAGYVHGTQHQRSIVFPRTNYNWEEKIEKFKVSGDSYNNYVSIVNFLNKFISKWI